MKEVNDLTSRFRKAGREDTGKILRLIRELAEHKRMAGQVTATVETLEEWLFVKNSAEVFFILDDDANEIGYVLFFHTFSTFLGKAGIHVEDLYIKPEFRGKGYGSAAFREIARIAAERGCERVEWACLDWNKPSIGFYLSLGAVPLDEWTTYRLSGGALRNLAEGADSGSS
ncbi:MAG: GNAT family N-acetyltransferase [Synergistaceae bacterium]|nr:GNAT family N-acetyltransferase [Synergistaceae bacterium]